MEAEHQESCSPNGYFITVYRALKDIHNQDVVYRIFSSDAGWGNPGHTFGAEVVAFDDSKDLALFKAKPLEGDPPVEDRLSGFRYVPLSEVTDPLSDVTESLSYRIRRIRFDDPGFCEEKRRDGIDLSFFGPVHFGTSQCVNSTFSFNDNSIQYGDSGTPLFDESGRAYGAIIGYGALIGLDEIDNINALVSPLKPFFEELRMAKQR